MDTAPDAARAAAARRRPRPDHFSERAARYAAHRPGYPAALADWLASVAPARSLAWDAGCGSGQMSVLLGDRFARVIATDVSDAQLARATPHPAVEYRRAEAESTPIGDASVDLATAAQAAHWFDLPRYYEEVRRVTRPGAVVALVTYGLMTVDREVDAVVRRFHTEVLGPYWAPERRHVDDGYRSLPFPFDEIEPPAFEIRREWRVADVLEYVGTWSAVRAMEEAVGTGPTDALRRDLLRAWGDAPAVRQVRWPISIRAGRP